METKTKTFKTTSFTQSTDFPPDSPIGKEFQDMFKKFDKDFEKSGAGFLPPTIEVYGADKIKAIEAANQKADSGYRLSKIEERHDGVWVATMTLEVTL